MVLWSGLILQPWPSSLSPLSPGHNRAQDALPDTPMVLWSGLILQSWMILPISIFVTEWNGKIQWSKTVCQNTYTHIRITIIKSSMAWKQAVKKSMRIWMIFLKVVQGGSPRCPDNHDLSKCHRLHDLGRHAEPFNSLKLDSKNYSWQPPGSTLRS